MVGEKALHEKANHAEREQQQAQITAGAAVQGKVGQAFGNHFDRHIIQPLPQDRGVRATDIRLDGIDIRRDGSALLAGIGGDTVNPRCFRRDDANRRALNDCDPHGLRRAVWIGDGDFITGHAPGQRHGDRCADDALAEFRAAGEHGHGLLHQNGEERMHREIVP